MYIPNLIRRLKMSSLKCNQSLHLYIYVGGHMWVLFAWAVNVYTYGHKLWRYDQWIVDAINFSLNISTIGQIAFAWLIVHSGE